MLDRREFSSTLALATAAGLVRPRAMFGAGQQATVFDWRPINDSMRVAFGAGGNVLAALGDGHTLLVDTKHVGYGGVLRAEAESLGGPVERVINTHHHPDHIGSNPFFTKDVPVVGQTRGVARATAFGGTTLEGVLEDPIVRLESLTLQVRNMEISGSAKNEGSQSMAAFVAMARDLKPESFAATEVFDTELEVRIGSTTVELRYIDRGHTDNDIFLFAPEENVIHGGDLFFNGLHPRIDTTADATSVGWQRCIEAMIELADNDTVCIPGHGDISDIAGLRDFYDYFDILRAFVQKEIDAGRGRNQITEMQPPEFREWSRQRLDLNLGVIYDELTSG